MKWLKLLFAVLFVLFAVVQMNDPDPFGWIAIYLAAAVILGMAFFDKYYLPLIGATLIAAVLWMIGLLPQVWTWIQTGAENIAGEMTATDPYIEFTREFLGLLLIAIMIYWQYRIARKRNRGKKGFFS